MKGIFWGGSKNWVHVSRHKGSSSQVICSHYEHVLSKLYVGETRVQLSIGLV